MNKDEVLKAYEDLSAEDRESVLAELTGNPAGEETATGGKGGCCSPEFMESMAGFKEKMKEGGDPASIFKEIMAGCCK